MGPSKDDLFTITLIMLCLRTCQLVTSLYFILHFFYCLFAFVMFFYLFAKVQKMMKKNQKLGTESCEINIIDMYKVAQK